MKGNDALLNAYNKQKDQFEKARATRISNRNSQIADIKRKIEALQATIDRLESLNFIEKDFEPFESFRTKAENQSRQQKDQKGNI